MTIFELQHRFNLEMEKHGITDPVMSTIIEDYINYAYQRYITDKYDSLINDVEKFEITERISRILAPLLKDYSTTVFVASTTLDDNGYYADGPPDLQYITAERAILSMTDCNGNAISRSARLIPTKHNMVSTNKNNPFLRPDKDDNEIWRLNIYSNRIEFIIYDDAVLSSYKCRYIKKQTPVSFNPVAPATGEMEIDSSVHEEIVIAAAYMYLSDLRNNKQKENAEQVQASKD